MAKASLPTRLLALAAASALCALAVLGALVAPAGAVDAGALEGRLASARAEAGSLAAELRESRAALSGAEAEAAAAAAREAEVAGLLAEGRARAEALRQRLERTRARLDTERQRLRRARAALAARVVAIYENGTPDTTSLILGADDYGELLTQTRYVRMIAESDSALASRVESVRDQVERQVGRVAALEREALAHAERLEAARAEIGAVREAAGAAAAELASVAAGREASLSSLRGKIDNWVGELEEARASEAEAEEEVGRWLGGPYTIPTYIVMCESGGDYGALNASSGAGGAYQIMPETWAAYGGQGEPQNAPKAEQDRIAAEIWADSGGSAWVCA